MIKKKKVKNNRLTKYAYVQQFRARTRLIAGQEYSLRDIADASRYRMRLISDHITQAARIF